MIDESNKIEDMKRVVVIGSSCSGKTTYAIRLARLLRVKYIEMDSINWLPEWQQRKTEDFRRIIKEETSGDKWVLDGNYSATRDITWNRATHIVWLNPSFPLVFYRVLKRTVNRVFTGEEVCGGNKESFRQTFFSSDSMIILVIRTYHSRRRRYKKQSENNDNCKLRFLVFNSSSHIEKFFDRVKIEVYDK